MTIVQYGVHVFWITELVIERLRSRRLNRLVALEADRFEKCFDREMILSTLYRGSEELLR